MVAICGVSRCSLVPLLVTESIKHEKFALTTGATRHRSGFRWFTCESCIHVQNRRKVVMVLASAMQTQFRRLPNTHFSHASAFTQIMYTLIAIVPYHACGMPAVVVSVEEDTNKHSFCIGTRLAWLMSQWLPSVCFINDKFTLPKLPVRLLTAGSAPNTTETVGPPQYRVPVWLSSPSPSFQTELLDASLIADPCESMYHLNY